MTWAHVTMSESRFKLRDPEPENEIYERKRLTEYNRIL